nr:M23 family metallopeptidase [Sphingomonas solaris]
MPPPAIGFVRKGLAQQGGLLRWRLAPGDPATIRLTLDGRPVPVAPDGAFLLAFGRDAAPLATLEASAPGRPPVQETIAVQPRAWKIQSLPTLSRGTTPNAAFLARREPELARIAAARAAGSASEGWRQRFVWPATGRISGVFGSQRIYAGEPGAFHGGVDVARPTGAPVVAPADGVVVLAAEAPFTLEGNLLMIDHGMGLVSAFLHLSRIDVKPGDRVAQGQPIGAVGATGRATGPHLHWGMTWGDVRIDPALLAGAMPG